MYGETFYGRHTNPQTHELLNTSRTCIRPSYHTLLNLQDNYSDISRVRIFQFFFLLLLLLFVYFYFYFFLFFFTYIIIILFKAKITNMCSLCHP